jgi:hypothetical protein
VSIRSSVKPDHIVCLEDGKKLKMLKRYLMTKFQMTPDQYRAKWDLKSDYPMVAPNYSETRKALALTLGLGRKAKTLAGADKAPAKPQSRARKAAPEATVAPKAPTAAKAAKTTKVTKAVKAAASGPAAAKVKTGAAKAAAPAKPAAATKAPRAKKAPAAPAAPAKAVRRRTLKIAAAAE